MLILDVKTCWSSTHQMLHECKIINEAIWLKFKSGCALDFRSNIDDFVAKNCDLCKFEMHTNDWDAITLVTQWLKTFWSATTQMSTMKLLMLSSAHAIFHGLQESLCESLHTLPNNTLPWLKLGLMRANWKLSDYFGKFDDLPFYTWSSCE